MQIKNFYSLNLEELYRACCVKQNAIKKDKKFTFNSNLINLYNHIEITFLLDDVSIYEYMLLKRFSSRCSKLNDKTILYSSPDYNTEIYNYAKLIHKITTDDTIVNTPIKHNYPFLYGPAFLVRGNCAITLTGRELISILDLDPSNLFIPASNGKCFLNLNSPEFDDKFDISNGSENNILLINYIEQRFVKAFYNNFFISSTTSSDIVSDTAIHNYFSNHDSLITLESISNPIFTYNIKRENLDNKSDYIDSIKKSDTIEIKKYFNRDEIIDNTYLVFNLYTRFSTYINLLENLPKEFFISYEDLKVPFNFKEIYIPIEFYENYSTKLEDAYTNLNMYLDNEHKNFYVKYQCTYLNSIYSYSIKIKLDDINKYINLINKNLLLSESKEVVDSIIKFGSAVLKMF